MDSEPGPLPGRRREIDTRLDAVRARLQALRERDVFGHQAWTTSPRERVAAAKRYAAEAHAAATRVLASSAEAFRNAAEAHERAASMHERTAAGGIGDVQGTSGKQRSTALLPPRTGSVPNVSNRFFPAMNRQGLLPSPVSHATT